MVPPILSRTLYAYNQLGDQTVTAQDANGNGVIDVAGPDRVTSNDVQYAKTGNDWWRESRSYIFPTDGTAKLVGTQRQRLTGLGTSTDKGLLVSESRSFDILGNETEGGTRVTSPESSISIASIAGTAAKEADIGQIVSRPPTAGRCNRVNRFARRYPDLTTKHAKCAKRCDRSFRPVGGKTTWAGNGDGKRFRFRQSMDCWTPAGLSLPRGGRRFTRG